MIRVMMSERDSVGKQKWWDEEKPQEHEGAQILSTRSLMWHFCKPGVINALVVEPNNEMILCCKAAFESHVWVLRLGPTPTAEPDPEFNTQSVNVREQSDELLQEEIQHNDFTTAVCEL